MKHTQESNPTYFEGILQLRNPSQEVVDFVEDSVERDKKCWVSEIKEVRNGLDFYLSSNQYLKTLGKKLKEKFPGELKMSSSLHTKSKTGKDLYRGTVLFRFIDIKKGDQIEDKGEEYEVLGVGTKVLMKNIKTGKKKQLGFEEINR